jgi:hypothetical protein
MDIDDMKGLAMGLVQPLFALGFVCATPHALEVLTPEEIRRAVARHSRGDWGDLDKDDWTENEEALRHGSRLFSVYPVERGNGRFWVITEADRSVTTVLMPSDY